MVDFMGVRYPAQLDGTGDIASAEGDALDQCDLELLLEVQRGELPWDPGQGTRLRELLHTSKTKLARSIAGKAIALRDVADQINKYASRFLITDGSVTVGDSSVVISVKYVRRDRLNRSGGTVAAEVF